MAELNKPTNKQKPARLGRGLGSLLSPEALDMNTSPSEPVPKQTSSPFESPLNPVAPVSTGPEPKATPTGDTIRPSSEVREENRIFMIDVEKIRPNQEQPRKEFRAEQLQELARSIKEKGILQPITVRRNPEGTFEIIAGERRWRAAQQAGLHQVPVIIRRADRQGSLELALIENIQREDLDPMEEAEAYKLLTEEYGLTQQQIADRVGKERVTIANALRLLALTETNQQRLKNGDLSTGHAKVLLSVTDPKLQNQIGKRIIQQGLSVRATEKLIKRSRDDQNAASPSIPDVSERLLDATKTELQKVLGRKVGIDYKNSKGKISIHFYSDEELSELIERLKKAWRI